MTNLQVLRIASREPGVQLELLIEPPAAPSPHRVIVFAHFERLQRHPP